MSNNEDILSGLNNLLKNVDLSQLTSLMSSFNTASPEGAKQNPLASQIDLSQITSMLSNIDLGQIGSLLSGMKLGESEDSEEDDDQPNSLLSGLNLDALKNLNIQGLNLDNLNGSGLFNIEELQAALSDFTEKLQGFRKFQ